MIGLQQELTSGLTGRRGRERPAPFRIPRRRDVDGDVEEASVAWAVSPRPAGLGADDAGDRRRPPLRRRRAWLTHGLIRRLHVGGCGRAVRGGRGACVLAESGGPVPSTPATRSARRRPLPRTRRATRPRARLPRHRATRAVSARRAIGKPSLTRACRALACNTDSAMCLPGGGRAVLDQPDRHALLAARTAPAARHGDDSSPRQALVAERESAAILRDGPSTRGAPDDGPSRASRRAAAERPGGFGLAFCWSMRHFLAALAEPPSWMWRSAGTAAPRHGGMLAIRADALIDAMTRGDSAPTARGRAVARRPCPSRASPRRAGGAPGRRDRASGAARRPAPRAEAGAFPAALDRVSGRGP